MRYFKNSIIFIMVALLMCFQSCNQDEWDTHNETDGDLKVDILERIKANPDLSIFYQVLQQTGYDNLLMEANSYTVFAPQNSAWQGVDMNDKEKLMDIVSYHIAYEKRISSNLSLYTSFPMVNMKNLRYDESSGSFAGAKIVTPDNLAGNGVVHITDKVFELKKNIWEYISSEYADLTQVAYIQSLNHLAMDMEKSIQIGVNSQGQAEYDTAWVNVNDFLNVAPLDEENLQMTYIVVKNNGFSTLYNKYYKYFTGPTAQKTDSATKYNICQDYLLSVEGILDITKYDTITSSTGVKIPIKGSIIETAYNASNGIVYVLDQSNVLLREKIKPVIIEGEDFSASAGDGYIYTRFKRWAFGERDIMLNCGNTQTDSVTVIGSQGQDSTFAESKTFIWDSGNQANVNNFWIEYNSIVNSVDYEIYYVAYDDIEGHYSDTNHVFRLEQKLFISFPNKPKLSRGVGNQASSVINNSLTDTCCFVGQDLSGTHKLTQLTKWILANNTTQVLKYPSPYESPTTLTVPNAGNLTMWLCNTTRSTTAGRQGMLFLDYIMLVPILPAE